MADKTTVNKKEPSKEELKEIMKNLKFFSDMGNAELAVDSDGSAQKKGTRHDAP